ncbi:MAG: hypothetical protein ACR2G6_02025 [Gemmatimonadaceae bacterium]
MPGITAKELRATYGKRFAARTAPKGRLEPVPSPTLGVCPLCSKPITDRDVLAVDGKLTHLECGMRQHECVWCGRSILSSHGVIELAGRRMHDGNGPDCRAQFDTMVYGGR